MSEKSVEINVQIFSHIKIYFIFGTSWRRQSPLVHPRDLQNYIAGSLMKW